MSERQRRTAIRKYEKAKAEYKEAQRARLEGVALEDIEGSVEAGSMEAAATTDLVTASKEVHPSPSTMSSDTAAPLPWLPPVVPSATQSTIALADAGPSAVHVPSAPPAESQWSDRDNEGRSEGDEDADAAAAAAVEAEAATESEGEGEGEESDDDDDDDDADDNDSDEDDVEMLQEQLASLAHSAGAAALVRQGYGHVSAADRNVAEAGFDALVERLASKGPQPAALADAMTDRIAALLERSDPDADATATLAMALEVHQHLLSCGEPAAAGAEAEAVALLKRKA